MIGLICGCLILFWFNTLVQSGNIIHDNTGIIEIDNNNNRLLNEYNRRNLILSPNILSNDKQSLLNIHNIFRTMISNGSIPNQPSSSNMNYLFWDNGLANVASNYASKCIWTHNGLRSSDLLTFSNLTSFTYVPTNGVGENLYMTSANYITSIESLNNGIKAWFNEYASYTYSSSYQNNAGHYSQLIWANTRYIGCGYYQCPSVIVYNDLGIPITDFLDGATIFVCNYYPAGNWGGQYPYKSGTSCSLCDADRTKCDQSLCGGCMSSNFNYNGNLIPINCNNGLNINVDNIATSTSTTSTTTSTSSTTSTTSTTTTKTPTNTPTTMPSTTPTTTTTTTTGQPTTTTSTTTSRSDSPTSTITSTSTSTTTTTTTASPTSPSQAPTPTPTKRNIKGSRGNL